MKCDLQVVGNFQLFFLRLIILAFLGVLRRTNFDKFSQWVEIQFERAVLLILCNVFPKYS